MSVIMKLIAKILAFTTALTMISNPCLSVIKKVCNIFGKDEQVYFVFQSDYITKLLAEDTDDLFSDSAKEFATSVIRAVIIEFMTGDYENDTITNALAELPHSDCDRTQPVTYEESSFETAIKKMLEDENFLTGDIRGIASALANGINDIYIYFRDTEFEGVYEFCGSYVEDSGRVGNVRSGVYYNSKTGEVFGKDNNGAFGIGFDFNVKEYKVVTPVGAWQRNFGFNVAYDVIGNILFMDCETVRIKFNFGGKDRMVQMWKGNYTHLSNGAEIGFYYLKDGEKFQYTCGETEDERPMSMTLRTGDTVIMKCASERHWWLSGFKIGPTVNCKDMVLDFAIDFQDSDYAKAFSVAAALKGIATDINGTVVTGSW